MYSFLCTAAFPGIPHDINASDRGAASCERSFRRACASNGRSGTWNTSLSGAVFTRFTGSHRNKKIPAKLNTLLGQDKQIFLRCHPAWRTIIIRPLIAYHHMPAFDHGGPAPSPILCLKHFCSPSEVHSVEYLTLRSHRPQLSHVTGKPPTYSSSTVFRSIIPQKPFVKKNF